MIKAKKKYELASFGNLVGHRLKSVTQNEAHDELIFELTNGQRFKLYHEQDCCESVGIEDIDSPLKDLNGLVTQAEETTNGSVLNPNSDLDSFTWTFYRITTAHGSATIRWLGISNGYYSERVDWKEIESAP